MCTAISYKTYSHYFGRNLDLEYRYNETIAITPRNFKIEYQKEKASITGYAMIGMATVADMYPLYYEAINEHGLGMAALNFPGNAMYHPTKNAYKNIASFEMIPWVLRQCKTVQQARTVLSNTNVTSSNFNEKLVSTPLHWMLSDKSESIVVEPLADGLKIYDNPMGVLTNNPPFPFHMQYLNNFINLTNTEPINRFSDKVQLNAYSRGMGTIGLPGDPSSASRFVKATFTKLNSVCDCTESDSVCQFFHILGAVEQQKGCVKVNNAFEKTIYTCCCNTDKGIYYYKTYENNQITAINLFHEDLDGNMLYTFPLITDQCIRYEN